MKISTEQLDNCQAVLTIEVEPERVERFLRQGARRLANRVRVPGFRKGKAPYQVIVSMLGKEAIYREILDDLVNEAYREALTQSELEPIAQPELDDIQLEPLVIRMRVPLAPEVKPGDYRSIRVEQEEIEVSDEDIDEVLEELRESRSRWVEVDRPAEYGDLLTLDIKGTVGDETVIDQTDWDFVPSQDTEAELLPGFDAAFIGMEPGETREFTLTYPADSDSRWAGQEAHFVATLKKIQRREEIELDDEFAASIGDFRTLDDLRENIRNGLKAERERDARSKHVEQVLEALVASAEVVKYPPALLEQEIDNLLQDQERQLQSRGISLDDYLKLTQVTREQYRESLRSQAEQRLVRGLLLGAVAEAEGISVEPEEVEAEISRMLQSMQGESREQARYFFRTATARQIIAQELWTQKTLERLLAIARGEVEEAAETAETEATAEEAVTDQPGEPVETVEASEPDETVTEDVQEPEAIAQEAVIDQLEEPAGTVGVSEPDEMKVEEPQESESETSTGAEAAADAAAAESSEVPSSE